MKIFLKLMFFVFAVAVCSAPARSSAPPQRDFERALQQEGLVGAVWSTVDAGGAVAVGAAGLKSAATGARMTADNKVHVGSVAKTVLAMGVLRLVTEGRLSLDTPVAPILPSLRFDNAWQATDPVRVRHLLEHTSGLDNIRFWQLFSTVPRADAPLGAAFEGDPSLLTVRARPGSRYAYSNMGYGLLGMLIEAVTGQRYEQYLKTQLLLPLGMADSTFDFVTQTGERADTRLAMGHFEKGAPQAALPMYLRSAGQFTTTAGDMGRFAAFLLGDGATAQGRLVRADLMEELHRPVHTDAAKSGLAIGHGLAMAARDRHGVVGACHPGVAVGYSAMLCVYRPQGKAFFIAFNADSESANYEQFYQRLLAELALAPGPGATPVPKQAAPDNTLDAWRGLYVPVAFTIHSLSLVDVVFNFVRLDRNESGWNFIPAQGGSKLLVPAGGVLLQGAGRTEPTHVLLRAADGTPRISDGLRTYEQTSWWRMVLLWGSVAAGLSGLLYVLLAGAWRLAARRGAGALAAPFAAVLSLLLPVPLFVAQSFLQLGDRTPASLLLAAVTGVLPLAMAWGLWRTRSTADSIALVAVVQFLGLLAVWGMLPFFLWK